MGSSNSTTSSTSSTDIFGSNAFTDFAPLLTLFGDEVTKQFLSTSISISDNVLLGVAPIGIMTVIISAIRVGGNRFMKSLIGRIAELVLRESHSRARDSPDDEEREILSSTSSNVREIWNGHRVVRQIGGSKTIPFLVEPGIVQSPTGTRPSPSNSCLRRLEHVMLDVRVMMGRARKANSSLPELLSGTTEPFHLPKTVPPNLSLNIPGVTKEGRTVILLVIFGFLVQVAVMIVNAVIVYQWQWLRSGQAVASYAYPIWAIGTVAITTGVCLCGWVVKRSTRNITVLAHGTSNKVSPDQLQIIFLQQKMPEQGIPAYSIESISPGKGMVVSERLWPLTSEHNPSIPTGREAERGVFVFLGAALGLSGFVCQNIGTRALHWSAGLIQLGATVLLTLIRAWLRRHVGISLKEVATVRELKSGFEACDLATHLTKHDCYLLSTSCLCGKDTTKDIYYFPGLHDKLTDCTKGGIKDYHHTVSSTLISAHMQAAQYEPVADFVVKAAANCYKAMEEILSIIDPKLHDEFKYNVLGTFLFMVLSGKGQSNLDGRTASPRVPEGARQVCGLPFQDVVDRVQFLQTIINLTHYAHGDFAKSGNGRIFRILGHCNRDDLEAYTLLLRAWINPHGDTIIFGYPHCFSKVSACYSRPFAESEGGIDSLVSSNCRIFGLRYSYTFQKAMNSIIYEQEKTPGVAYTQNNKHDGLGRSQKYDAECDLVWDDWPDRSITSDEICVSNIVQDIMSSFMLQLAQKLDKEVLQFMSNNTSSHCQTLVDVLLRHNVCQSKEHARVVIVPALIGCGILYHWPEGYNPPEPPVEESPEKAKWDDKEVRLDWPPRRTLTEVRDDVIQILVFGDVIQGDGERTQKSLPRRRRLAADLE